MNSFNQLKDSLTPGDIDSLVKLLNCRANKEIHLKHYLTKDELRKKIPVKPIFERLFKDADGWKFFAIIDQRSEIRMVRNYILGVY